MIGLLIRFILFKVCVNHGSGFDPRTIFGFPRVAKAFADAGNRLAGILVVIVSATWDLKLNKRRVKGSDISGNDRGVFVWGLNLIIFARERGGALQEFGFGVSIICAPELS